jgi:hypothetical protein
LKCRLLFAFQAAYIVLTKA